MMRWVRQFGGAVLPAVLALTATGCLERKETIRIAPDGGVQVRLEYSGEPEQFETADVLPSEASGWRVQSTTERQDEGKEKIALTGARSFAPREELPGNYSAKDDPNSDLYLQFPTTVQVERRPDGVYLHFKRVYSPRPWAYVQYWQDQLIDDDVKQRAAKPVEEMSHEDRVSIIKAFAEFEFHKQMELLKAAGAQLGAELPQDIWLQARQALVDAADETDWGALVEAVIAVPEPERDIAFENESQRLLDRTHAAFMDRLSARMGSDESLRNRFDAAYERARTQHQISSELAGHGFKIEVYMPGEIVAHNADQLNDDGAVVWEFTGDAFRDRPFELMVSAKLPRHKNGHQD